MGLGDGVGFGRGGVAGRDGLYTPPFRPLLGRRPAGPLRFDGPATGRLSFSCRAVPPVGPRIRPTPGTMLRAGPARVRKITDRAGLGTG